MKHIPTQTLRDMVAPAKLEDVLEDLRQGGLIEEYALSAEWVSIKASKHMEIALLLKEESTPQENPRPYVKNKLTKHKK